MVSVSLRIRCLTILSKVRFVRVNNGIGYEGVSSQCHRKPHVLPPSCSLKDALGQLELLIRERTSGFLGVKG